jgi:anti-sigma factor RsiW
VDRREAKLILQSLRPDDLTTDKSAAIEALVFVERDPELKAWWATHQAFDAKVAAKLKEVPVPPDLRENLLAARKVRPFPAQPQLGAWLAIAAVVAILCVVGATRYSNAYGPLAESDFDDATLPLVHNNAPNLAIQSPDHDKIVAWLKDHNAPLGTMPSPMTSLPTLGCQKYVIHGHDVSLICFALAGGREAHLFIIDQKALIDPPGKKVPDFKDMPGGWSLACWSDDQMSYVLATDAGQDALKQLL